LKTCRSASKGCSFYMKMQEVGNHTVAACIDMNSDGDFNDFGESEIASVSIDCHFCTTRTKCNSLDACNGWSYAQRLCLNEGES